MSAPAVLDTHEEWTADAVDRIRGFALAGLPFTADHFRRGMRPAPHPNLVGNAFRVAYRKGLITECGTTCSTTPSRRGSLIRQWVGVA